MEQDEEKRTVKIDPFVGDGNPVGGKETLSNVDKLRGYYDEARNRLKNYLGRDEAGMGSGSSSPRTHDDGGGGGGGDGVGGVVFQQRPAHIRLEGKQALGGEEFTDISYSDLGFIITPQSKKITLHNNNNNEEFKNGHESTNDINCMQWSPAHSSSSTDTDDSENDFDSVSSRVNEDGNGGHTSVSRTKSSNRPTLSTSAPNINFGNPGINQNDRNGRHSLGELQHRVSDGSFTLAHTRASAKIRLGEAPDRNLDDLRLEEVTT